MATTIPNTVASTRNHQAQSRLLSMMPVEIILDIADQTECVAYVVCLALTCKDAFSILSKYIKKLGAGSREILLTTLERNISWVVYCPIVHKLVNFGSKKNIYYYPTSFPNFFPPYDIFQVSPFPGPPDIGRTWPGKSLSVSFLATRLVRNHRLFGATHGIPLSCLSSSERKFTSFTFMNTKRDACIEMSRTAKWMDDNLYLSYTLIFRVLGVDTTAQPVPAASLYNFLLDTRPCRHCRLSEYHGTIRGALDPALTEAETKLSRDSVYEATGSCLLCETDWDLSISWSPQRSLVFKCVTYHDLGCCSIPPDPKWKKLVGGVGWNRSGIRESYLGRVRDMWVNSNLFSQLCLL